MAMANSRWGLHPAIVHMRSIYLLLGRDLKRTEQFFVQEFGMPQSTWDGIPKALITNV